MKRFVFPAVALAVALAVSSHAQETEEAPTRNVARFPIWKCETPAGVYSVAVRTINAVSMSEYVVDNAARVFEVNIDTDGNLLPRFYYLEPLTAESPLGIGQSTLDKTQEILEEAADRTGQSALWSQVVKNYPNTTHAHTVEFRVDSRESLEKIYKSAEKAFRLQRADTLNLQ